jgi:hypothetical protein
MRHEEETIETVPFRINLAIACGVVIALVGATYYATSAYLNILSKLNEQGVAIASILDKVSASNATMNDLAKKVDDLNSRVSKLEYKANK